jgi:transcriptional regulator with XRE-family HTH domain
MQAKQLSDHELVKICMMALCENAGFPDTAALVQRDLQTLTDAIETRTGVLISLSTIKRLLNGQFTRLPQIATLNALAQYLDYPSWQAFRIAQRPGATPSQPNPIRPAQKNRRPRILAAAALLLTTLALLAVKLAHPPTLANLDKAQFSATKVTGNDLPNSVIFRYNIDEVTADSFFIQQSWDRNRRVRIYKKNYTLTDIYYEPGYHTAKLFANDKIIKTIDVSIPTDHWTFYVKEEPFKGHVVYINPAHPTNDGPLQLTPEDLAAQNIDIPKYNAFIQVYFPSHLQYSSDDFTLRCRVRVSNINNANCPFLMTEIFCQRNFMYFQNRLKGCTSETIAEFGDNFLNGKTHDLSGLGADITSWQHLTFTVKDRKATVSINDIPAYSATYQVSSGLITGLGFVSNGLCAVDSIDLGTGDGKPIITYHPPSAQ